MAAVPLNQALSSSTSVKSQIPQYFQRLIYKQKSIVFIATEL